MGKILGTPIYVFNADDPANRGEKDGQASTTSRIEETLKALKPLDKARTYAQNAIKALDGTAYEDIVKGLDAIVQNITATEQKVVAQISGAAQQAAQPQAAQASPAVPTAGQIAGREPLPEQQ